MPNFIKLLLPILMFCILAQLIAFPILALAKGYAKVWYVLINYSIHLIIPTVLFYVYFKYFDHLSPFGTMAVAMLIFFALDFVIFKYFYKGELWFLNFIDYILPAFLIASTIYFVGKLIK